MSAAGGAVWSDSRLPRAASGNVSGHRPVLLDSTLAGLAVRPGGVYVDATYGRGGHSAAILEALRGRGQLVVLDRDADACAHARRRWQARTDVRVVQANFAGLAGVLEDAGVADAVDGIVFDLGVSSPQLDTADRGFSFRLAGPLDMRMDTTAGESAAEFVGRASVAELARVLRAYGEGRLAGRIARHIVAAREQAPIETTDRLAAIVRSAVPAAVAAGSRIDPATRTFQALRMHVNGELPALRAALAAVPGVLAPGGRLAVISFHSGEDRIVKRFMRDQARPEPPPVPMAEPPAPTLRLVGKQVRADAAEIQANPRARSAILRVAERTQAPA